MEIKEFIEKFAESVEIEDAEALTAATEFHELDEWSSLSVMLVIAFFDEVFVKQVGDMDKHGNVNIQRSRHYGYGCSCSLSNYQQL